MSTSSSRIKLLIALAATCTLAACGVTMPPGQEHSKEFTQTISTNYRDAYQLIARQMRACFRVIGPFGNGQDIQADLDTANNQGRIELYGVGLTGSARAEDIPHGRIVTIARTDSGAQITVRSNTPSYAYSTHLSIAKWLSGDETCGHRPFKQKGET